MKKSKGAVTVFLIIVLFTTVLLGGLFIDASRILLAKRYIRNAMDSAGRSALSYYDSHLASEYGLFAVEQDKAEAMFRKYFKTNLELSQNDGFDILQMDVEDGDITVDVSGEITNKDILMDSMKEYSKYRVAVNSAVGVVEKLKGLLGGGKGTAAVNSAKKGKDALESFKDEVTDLSESARDYLSKGVKTQKDRVKNVVTNSILSGRTDKVDLGFDDIGREIDKAAEESSKIDTSKKDYQKKSKEAVEEAEGAKTGSITYQDEKTGEYRTETAADTGGDDSGTRSDLPDPSQAADKEKQAVDAKIQETRDRFAKKKTEIEKKVKEAQELNKEITRLKASKELDQSQVNILQARKRTLEENRNRDRFAFILGDDPDAKTLELQQKYELVKLELEQLRVNNASAEEIGEKEKEVTAAGEALKKQIEDSTGETAKTAYDDEIKQTDADLKAAKERVSDADKEIKKQEEKRDKLVDEIKKLYDEIPAEESGAGELDLPKSASEKDQKETAAESGNFLTQLVSTFQKAANELGKVDDDINSREGLGEFSLGLDALLEDGLGTVERLWKNINGLVKLITGSADTDNAFLFTDYVFSTHTFLTSQTPRTNRHFQAGEIEYILTGRRGQAKAIAEVLKDIALLRLSINFVDYFATGKSPEIISRTLIALGRAAVRTVKDMADMIFSKDKDTSAACGLCPSFQKLKLTYSDHLRLSMALRALDKAERGNMTDRLLVMMRDTYKVQNWGDVDNRRTRIKGEATVEVDLVMLTLPMFEAVLPEDNQILQDGKFLVHAAVELGY